MRIAGAVVLVATTMAAAILCLLPTSVSLLGTSASCDPPIQRVVLERHQPDDHTGLTQQCVDQSVTRIVIAGVVFLIGGLGGGLMFGLGGPNNHQANWPSYGPPH